MPTVVMLEDKNFRVYLLGSWIDFDETCKVDTWQASKK